MMGLAVLVAGHGEQGLQGVSHCDGDKGGGEYDGLGSFEGVAGHDEQARGKVLQQDRGVVELDFGVKVVKQDRGVVVIQCGFISG